MNTRRDFLKEVLAGVVVVGFAPGILVSCSDSTSSNANEHGTFVVNVSALDTEGKALRSQLPEGTPIMIVRRPSATFVTLQLICQHQGCRGDSLQQSGQRIVCSCHGSQYDLDGNVTQGPAQRDLVTYTTAYDAAKNEVTITY